MDRTGGMEFQSKKVLKPVKVVVPDPERFLRKSGTSQPRMQAPKCTHSKSMLCVHQLYIVQERTNEQLYKICTATLANVALPDMCLLVLSILKPNTSPLHIQNFAGFSASCKPILVSNLTSRWKSLTNTQINITR